MISVLYLIPVLAIVTGVFLYRLNGKGEFLKIDLVQFFYAFFMAPVLFVWLKTFLFVILRTELDISLSSNQLYLVDTIYSVVYLYVFGFVVIHALTKSFSLRRSRDPLYDIFEHSEFFHLWLTHLIVFVGTLLLVSALAIFNIFYPIDLQMSQELFYLFSASGILTGILFFLMVWQSDPKQDGANFMRFMKLMFGLFFVVHIIFYFLFAPAFDSTYGVYWWSLGATTGLVTCSFFVYRFERVQTLFERVSSYFKHHKWEQRIQLFERRK
ncbi:MAG: hypothetical protein WDZ94_02605 [Patescibacteria group bacterium]